MENSHTIFRLHLIFFLSYTFCAKILTCNIDSDEIRDDLSLVGDCYALAGELIQHVHHLAPLQLQPDLLVPAFGVFIQPVLLLGRVYLLLVAEEEQFGGVSSPAAQVSGHLLAGVGADRLLQEHRQGIVLRVPFR